MNKLHQLGAAIAIYAQHYGEGTLDSYPPWLTLLTTTGGKYKYIDDLRLLCCPLDGSEGAQGCRPDGMRYANTNKAIEQLESADIDEHPGPLDGASARKNKASGGINCSYLYEWNGEPCEEVYGKPPITSGTIGSVPTTGEWQWGRVPSWGEFLALADANHDGVLSWNEVKTLSRSGCRERGLKGWGIRVPVIRCYWHVAEQGVLKDDSLILELLGDGSTVQKSVPAWYR